MRPPITRHITELTPSAARGFAANLATGHHGVGASGPSALPISTTHAGRPAVLGVGMRRGIGALTPAKLIGTISSLLADLPCTRRRAFSNLYSLSSPGFSADALTTAGSVSWSDILIAAYAARSFSMAIPSLRAQFERACSRPRPSAVRKADMDSVQSGPWIHHLLADW